MTYDYDDYIPTRQEKFIVLSAGYVAIAGVAYLFYRSIVLAALAGGLCVFVMRPYKSYKAERRKELLMTQFKDVLYSLSSSIAAGRQMRQALAEAYRDIAIVYDSGSPMVKELGYIVRGISDNRESEEGLLVDFARRSKQEDIRNFVDVYRASRSSGGDIETVIKNASDIMTDKMTIEKEIRTLTAQKMFEGRIISIMPLLVVLFLNVFSPDYISPMYETIAGRLVMTVAMIGIIASYILTMKLIKIEV